LSKRVAAATTASAPAEITVTMFVVTQVRQALQQAVAIGVCSAYLPAA
jgi:hypothetical protein